MTAFPVASAGSVATAGLQIYTLHAYRYKIPAFTPPCLHRVNKGLRRPFTVARMQVSQAHDAMQIEGFLVHSVLYTLSICTKRMLLLLLTYKVLRVIHYPWPS